MAFIKQFWFLFYKELLIEWRQRHVLSGILLYVFSSVFVVFIILSRAPVNFMTWNALFWIMALFTTLNAVVKSFNQENSARALFYYHLAPANAFLLAKITYNTALLLGLNLLVALALSIILQPVQSWLLFTLVCFLAALGFSIIFTFLSNIAGKTQNSATLIAILGLPAVIPTLMELQRISGNALGLEATQNLMGEIAVLLGIDCILIGVAIVLFPFLWRE